MSRLGATLALISGTAAAAALALALTSCMSGDNPPAKKPSPSASAVANMQELLRPTVALAVTAENGACKLSYIMPEVTKTKSINVVEQKPTTTSCTIRFTVNPSYRYAAFNRPESGRWWPQQTREGKVAARQDLDSLTVATSETTVLMVEVTGPTISRGAPVTTQSKSGLSFMVPFKIEEAAK